MFRSTFFFFVVVTSVKSQQYELSLDPLNPYIASDGRVLQTSQPSCSASGDRFLCDIATDIRGSNNATITVSASIDCPFTAQAQVDYRKAEGCMCSAQVISPGGDARNCPCLLCPSGFGNNPVAIDCDYNDRPEEVDPFIIGPCSSFDCSFACNGTCSFGCEEPVAPECQDMCYASGEPTEAPEETDAAAGMTSKLLTIFIVAVGAWIMKH